MTVAARELHTAQEVRENFAKTRAYFDTLRPQPKSPWQTRCEQLTRDLEVLKAERDQYRATSQQLRTINAALMERITEIQGLAKAGQIELVSGPIDPNNPNDLSSVTVEKIQKAVCEHFKINRRELLSPRRTKEIVWPRHIAMYLAHQHTSNSMPMIGRLFGHRDHTTVLHAVRRIVALLSEDVKLGNDIKRITARLMVSDPAIPAG